MNDTEMAQNTGYTHTCSITYTCMKPGKQRDALAQPRGVGLTVFSFVLEFLMNIRTRPISIQQSNVIHVSLNTTLISESN